MWVGIGGVKPNSKQQQVSIQYPECQAIDRIVQQLQEKLNLTCSICSHRYDTQLRTPKIVCRRQHTYCADCVSLILRSRPLRCPECRFKIYGENIFVNRAIYSFCQTLPRLEIAIKTLARKNKELEQKNQKLINDHQDKNCVKQQLKFRTQTKSPQVIQKSRQFKVQESKAPSVRQKNRILKKVNEANPQQISVIHDRSKRLSSKKKQRVEPMIGELIGHVVNRHRMMSIANRRP